MITIYHNPRCSKSRQTLQLLEDRLSKDVEIEIVEYLKSSLTVELLKKITKLLNCSVRDIIRTSEADFKDNNLMDAALSDEELFAAIVKMPKLLQRPIVLNGDKAAIGRPPESVLDIL
ncbi:MAG: arsenate reductase (glutaredoxin) [Gammaproteobacteria bacterium]|nr:MAG: arsenate reductase (glutaredoxin) [Gammaproteobacteria bacterium]